MSRAALALAVIASATPVRAAGRLPSWAEAIRSAPHAPAAAGEHAVVLWNSESVDLQADGRLQRAARGVIQIADGEGAHEATVVLRFEETVGKVRDLSAWLLTPAGELVTYRREQAVDLSLLNGQLRSDVRMLMLSAAPLAVPGSTFAYSWEVEDRTPLAQFSWDVSRDLPVRRAELRVRVPEGWTVESHPSTPLLPPPTVDAEQRTWTWLTAEVPAADVAVDLRVQPEPGRWLGVSCQPPSGAASTVGTFAGWDDAARWASRQMEPGLDASGPLAMRATALASNARTRLDTLRSVGRFVQDMPYEAIELGLGRGGGYRPRVASEVFAKGYGDCKDKVNLMRALLRVLGIPSRPVLAWSGDSLRVNAAWPSPAQFNHCIVAVGLPAQNSVPAQVQLAQRGTLVLFDPTDPATPLGELPASVQGGWALFADDAPDALFRVPAPDRARTHLAREGTLRVEPNGSITGSLRGGHAGGEAARARTHVATGKADDIPLQWLSQEHPGATVRAVQWKEGLSNGRLDVTCEIAIPRAADVSQPGRVLLRPGLFGTGLEGLPVDGAGSSLRLAPISTDDVLVIGMPVGSRAEALPEAVDLQSAFGRYERQCDWREGALHWRRRLALPLQTVPASEWRELRAFIEAVRRHERAFAMLSSGPQ